MQRALDGRGLAGVGQAFGEPGHMGGAKVDDLGSAAAVNHDVFGPQVLVQHFLAVKGLQALGDLRRQAAHAVQVGRGVVHHPSGQGLALDVFHGDVQVRARALRGVGPEHMRVVQPLCHPLFQHEALQVGGVIAQRYRRQLQHQGLAGLLVHGQVHMAAVADMQLTHHPKALK